MKSIYWFILSLLLVALLTACAGESLNPGAPGELVPTVSQTLETAQPATTASVQPTPVEPMPVDLFTVELLKNLPYHLQTVAEAMPETGGDILLKDGQWAQNYPNAASSVVVQYLDSAIGDLNGDGLPDAVVLLVIDTGGSGRFVQLATVLNQGGAPMHTTTLFLGDRVNVKKLSIVDGKINAILITHGPQDPQCCPSIETEVVYRLDGNELVEQK